MKALALGILFSLFLFSACEKQTQKEVNSISPAAENVKTPPVNLQKAMQAVEPFFKPMGEPSRDEWLAIYKEGGQTFEQYFNGKESQHFYLLKIVNPGKFRVSPARVQPMYQPQYLSTTESKLVEVR